MMEDIKIQSRDYWFKVIEMLQQNWALIEQEDAGVTVYFIGDTSGVFDKLSFSTVAEAERELLMNGFSRFSEDPEAQKFLACPEPPFYHGNHPNGPIYSSGRYWRSERNL
ncbi:hypothetical protein G0Q06_11800 [Puniceicoccales bacterium CK1056]|uniref:Uncharacterized protein n=1 Tax=Oceanipulchritudo coccoides TaxID=2706888 RepID=A0A6B2M2G5_9BACT|nr:hypothetical protein [Oceanipulchritudo coccoides]NDV63138.1 hypothetical protein [Oceanipulchritudo coccoides]